jgi:predicted permease
MSWFAGVRARARLLFARRAAESRINEEIAFHIEMETERLVREERLSRDEARRRALATFGGVTQHKEHLREERGFSWLGGASLDGKLALRMLVKHPGLTLVGVVGMAVAVAIGAVTFSAIHTVIGGALPFSDGDRIVALRNIDTHSIVDGRATHLHDLATWRSELTTVPEVGAYRVVQRTMVTGDGRSDVSPVAEMTASGFGIVRVPPLLGRYFNNDDERTSAAPVVVIGFDVWQNYFAARPDVVGQSIQLGGTRHTIIGVMPQGFAFPISNQLWTPLRLNPAEYPPAEAPRVDVFGRLAAGASIDDARQQAAKVMQRLAAAGPKTYAFMRTRIVPYGFAFVDNPESTWTYYLIELLVTGLLVVIGTNVAVLVYARTASRMGEIAVRTALGATRGRVVAQLFAEALAMSAMASVLGLVIAQIALVNINAMIAGQGSDIPFWFRFHITPAVVLYTAGLAVLAAIIVGVFPGLRATGRDVRANLQQIGAGGSGMRLGKGWTFMIVSQVGIAVAILPVAIAGVAMWSRLQTTEAKLAARRVLTMDVAVDQSDAPADSAASAARYLSVRDQFVRQVQAQPSVASISLATSAPGGEAGVDVVVNNARDIASQARIDGAYLSTFDIPLLAGRAFESADFGSASNVAIVNRSFVRKMLNGQNPLGQTVRILSDSVPGAATRSGVAVRVVGLVPDFPTDSGPLDPKIYRPLSAEDPSGATLAVRTRNTSAMAYMNPLRALAVSIDPALRLGNVKPLEQSFHDDQSPMRLFVVTVELITGATLLLSAAGIYALMAFTITRRRREIGIRSALGAGPRRVLAGVLWRAFAQIGVGVIVGIGIAWGIDAVLKGGWTGRNAATVLPGVVLLITIVGGAATVGPALRALRIAPTEALKAE